MITKERKAEMIKQFATSPEDTGSPGIQIAVLSERINQIAKHLQLFPKDTHSRFGLIKMVGKRRRLAGYLKKESKEQFETVNEKIKTLALSLKGIRV